MEITPEKAIQRGNHLLVAGFLAAIASGLLAILALEDEWIDRAEDGIVILLAIAAVIWYLRKDNRFRPSLIPYGLLTVAFIAKLAGLLIEFDDLRAVGDDILLLPPLVLMLIIAGYALYTTRHVAERRQAEPAARDRVRG